MLHDSIERLDYAESPMLFISSSPPSISQKVNYSSVRVRHVLARKLTATRRAMQNKNYRVNRVYARTSPQPCYFRVHKLKVLKNRGRFCDCSILLVAYAVVCELSYDTSPRYCGTKQARFSIYIVGVFRNYCVISQSLRLLAVSIPAGT